MAMEQPAQRDTTPLPSVTDILPVSAQHTAYQNSRITLPDLKTVLSNDFPSNSSLPDVHQQNHASPGSHVALPRMDPIFTNMLDRQISLESGMASPVTTASVMSVDDRSGRPRSVVSVEDENVLIAAQALSGLGNPAFIQRGSARPPAYPLQATLAAGEPEPLLELITQVHPWVGTTIKGASFAYSTTKHYSPRIVQYGANLVERSIAIPVASAVGSVGEYTGVDHTVRRYLDANRPNDVEQGRLDGNDSMSMDMDSRLHSRKLSIDSLTEPLPVYGATRPPSYREDQSPASVARFSQNMQGRQKPIRSWSSGLFVTSSGLSVALSTTSRQSLRFCLQLLSTSALRVSEFTSALKSILEQYEQHRQGWRENQDSSLEQGNGHRTPDQDLAIRQLADQIKMQSENIMKTLQHVVNNISEYAGGALPENARNFVRTQLMSLPQRWRVASGEQTAAGSETSKSAQRMIGFAKEGLEMITQVSGVMNATLESAEKWLERVGRRDEITPADEPMEDAEPTQPAQYDHYDVHKT